MVLFHIYMYICMYIYIYIYEIPPCKLCAVRWQDTELDVKKAVKWLACDITMYDVDSGL